MHTRAKLSSYEKLTFSITTMAPVEDWRAALKQLEGIKSGGYYGWPLSGFVGCIQKMLEDLDKTHADAVLKEDQGPSEHTTGKV